MLKAWTDPNFPPWWEPKNRTTPVDKMDVRPGGAWRIVQRDSSDKDYTFSGVHREIVPLCSLFTPIALQ
ncbi:MAG: SRPBCC domain-containing protein [Ktedonobacteraceae bacterium]